MLSKSRRRFCSAHILDMRRCKPCRLEGWHIARRRSHSPSRNAVGRQHCYSRRPWENSRSLFRAIVVCDIRTRHERNVVKVSSDVPPNASVRSAAVFRPEAGAVMNALNVRPGTLLLLRRGAQFDAQRSWQHGCWSNNYRRHRHRASRLEMAKELGRDACY